MTGPPWASGLAGSPTTRGQAITLGQRPGRGINFGHGVLDLAAALPPPP